MAHLRLIVSLMDKLFEAETRRLDRTVQQLNQENKQLQKSALDGFLFGGKFFVPMNVSTTMAGYGQAKPPLHPALHPQMREHMKDLQIVQEERRFISQTLHLLLLPCQTERQIRNALPECLVSCVDGLSAHPRSDEPAYTLQHDPRALRQYEKMLPKMELYSAARLLY
jgi:hypothetical protein